MQTPPCAITLDLRHFEQDSDQRESSFTQQQLAELESFKQRQHGTDAITICEAFSEIGQHDPYIEPLSLAYQTGDFERIGRLTTAIVDQWLLWCIQHPFQPATEPTITGKPTNPVNP